MKRILVLLAVALVAGCDDSSPTRDTTGQPTTTTSAKEDLERAATKAAADVKKEAKSEWKALDVKVQTGTTSPDSSRDAGKR